MSKQATASSGSTKRTAPKKHKPVVRKNAAGVRILQQQRIWWKPQTWHRLPPPNRPKLPKARHSFMKAVAHLRPVVPTAAGITAIYGVGVLLFVKALSAGIDLQSLSDTIRSATSNVFEARVVELGLLFNSSNAAASTSGTIFQIVFFIVCSLAIIWMLRTAYAKGSVGVKPALYQGMNQIVPYTIVLFIVSLQLLPLVVSSYLYSSLIYNGIAVTVSEQFIAFFIIIAAAFWSLRMLTSGIFATYIVSLAGMTPLASLRTARELVSGRRLLVWRKLLFLPLLLLLATILIVLPFLFLWPAAAVWVFYIVSICWLPLLHSYLYELYREMIAQ